jgi:hypothetical protein
LARDGNNLFTLDQGTSGMESRINLFLLKEEETLSRVAQVVEHLTSKCEYHHKKKKVLENNLNLATQ